ncbi:hypothetical protein [Nocardia jinanensis]|uniref:hypothetical protein n=1 Tax=Nocardia jinanensis TaxID=382504 RepID=UPI0012E3CBAC|nr:hypothetical protein [Nocardia jinanensis]
MTIFDPRLELGHPAAEAEPHIRVTVRPVGAVVPPPRTLRSAVYARDRQRIKHLGLFGAVHQRRTAQRNGFDNVVFTSADGIVSRFISRIAVAAG